MNPSSPTAPQLARGERRVVERQERGHLHPRRVRRAEIRRPVVPGPAQRDRERGVEGVHAHHRERAKEHADVEALGVHRGELRRRVEARRGVVLQHGGGAFLRVDPPPAERPRERELADRPLAGVGAAAGGGPGCLRAEGRIEIAVVEVGRLDHVQVAVEHPKSGSAHFWLLAE
jgi:hypothetical protein